MKKLLTVIFAICPMIASADYLDDKIANLTKQKLEKIARMPEKYQGPKNCRYNHAGGQRNWNWRQYW